MNQEPPMGSPIGRTGPVSRLAQTLRTDARRLLSTGVPHVFAALIGTQGMSTIQRILLARMLSEAELGQMTYVMSIVMVVVVVADLGVCTALLKFASEPVSEEEKRRLYVTALLWGVVSTSLTAVVYLAIVLGLGVGSKDVALHHYMLIVAPFIPLASLANSPLLFMQARKEIKRSARYTVITQLIGLVLVVGSTYRWKLTGYFVTVMVAPLANLVLLLIVTRAHLRWVRPTLELVRKLVSFGIVSMLANATGFANAGAAVVLLHHFGVPNAQIGLYAIALMVMTGTRLLPDSLMRVAFPYLSGLMRTPWIMRARQRELAFKQCAVVVAAAAAWLLVGSWAIRLVFGQRYCGGYWPSIVLLGGLIPYSISAPFQHGMVILNAIRLNFAISFAQLIINVVLCVLLIPLCGIVGAAAAVSGAQTLASAGAIIATRRVARRQTAEAQAEAVTHAASDEATG